jgi:hypothetical protein
LAICVFASDSCLAAERANFPARDRVQLVSEAPVAITNIAPGVVLVDFGRVAFGNLLLQSPPLATNRINVRFGEALTKGRVNRQPPGTVRYYETNVLLADARPLVVAPPPDKRNTRQLTGRETPDASGSIAPPAVLTPPEWGVIAPFRWVEIEGWPGEFSTSHHLQRRAAFAKDWDDRAASFNSSDDMLNRIWELCRHSIKATTFAGVYVDGDRERIPYEADAYLNQLSHYATDHDTQMARDTFDWLMKYPTWPTEWSFHMIFIAHANWWHTGDTNWLAARYESLKPKLLRERARADGLLVSGEKQIRRDDIVDWPVAERDGFVFKPVNTVVNAFYLRSLALMAELATALGKPDEAAQFVAQERQARTAFQEKLFDSARGLYRDGEGTDHASLHANLFPLAFGLVPAEHSARVTQWLAGRGMACSVYAAQYLLEGLFANGAEQAALALITAPTDRSWRHMIESGTTITWEAWDQKYKPNQDWNHAWGAAPANLLPRFVLGAQTLTPGWQRIRIRPHVGGLKSATGKIPTPRGPVAISWTNASNFNLHVTLPDGVKARVELPAPSTSRGVFGGDKEIPAQRIGSRWVLTDEIAAQATLEVR